MEFITEPLAFEFIQRAIIISVLIGIVCAILSCFLILKGWGLMGDAISHAVLPGIAIAYLLSIPLLIGAFVSALFCSVTISYIKNQCRVKEDAVMGILFSGMFALGLVMIVSIESDIHLLHILFGNVLGLSWHDVLMTSAVALLVSAIMLVKKSDFLLYCFDPDQLTITGLSVNKLVFSLQILLAITIVTALYTAGILLVISMLITPGATAFLLCKKFDHILIIAIVIAIVACFLGTICSYHFDISTAPLIVLFQSFSFVLAFCWHRFKQIKSPTVQVSYN